MAFNSKDTKLFWSASTAISTAQQVNDVISVDGPAGSNPVIDITHLLSTARAKLVGIQDEGQISVEMLLNTSDTGQIAIRADRQTGTERHIGIKYSTRQGTERLYLNAQAFVTNYSVGVAMDDKVTASFTLEIDGLSTWDAYTT